VLKTAWKVRKALAIQEGDSSEKWYGFAIMSTWKGNKLDDIQESGYGFW